MTTTYDKLYSGIISRNNHELGYKTLIASHNNIYVKNTELEKINKELRIKLLKYEESHDTQLNMELCMRDDYFC